MKMETVFVILDVVATRMDRRIPRIRIGPNKKKRKAINTKMITMAHPIRTEKGSAIERKTNGTGKLQGKIANSSEAAFVTKRVQKEIEPRRETETNREERGSAPLPPW
jgi:hypothetical protein